MQELMGWGWVGNAGANGVGVGGVMQELMGWGMGGVMQELMGWGWVGDCRS